MNYPTVPPKYRLSDEALDGLHQLYRDNPEDCPEHIVAFLLANPEPDRPQETPPAQDRETQ